MLINNRILNNYREGIPSIGTFSTLGDTGPDILSYTGLDYFIMDTEHSSLDDYQVEQAIAIAAGRGLTPIVRVKEIERTSVMRALDAGAHGIIVPNIKTVEQAEKLVEWGKFFPVGERGFSVYRGCGWSLGEQLADGFGPYLEYCNEHTLILPQCETKECLDDLENIVAVDGIDGIFLGPADLSLSLGIPMQYDHPDHKAAVERILNVCHDAGKICIAFAPDVQTSVQRFEQGFDSVTMSLDTCELQMRYAELVSEVRAGLNK